MGRAPLFRGKDFLDQLRSICAILGTPKAALPEKRVFFSFLVGGGEVEKNLTAVQGGHARIAAFCCCRFAKGAWKSKVGFSTGMGIFLH